MSTKTEIVYSPMSLLMGDGVALPDGAEDVTVQLTDELPGRTAKQAHTLPETHLTPSEPTGSGNDPSQGTPHFTTLFEGPEHTWLGNNITLQTDAAGTKVSAGKYPFSIAGSSLTYGQILALAGDFYGVPNQPVSTGGLPAFMSAYNTLVNANPTELQNILHVMQIQIDQLQKGVAEGKTERYVYEKVLGSTPDALFNMVTGGGRAGVDWSKVPLGLSTISALTNGYLSPSGRYMQLAGNNIDHFGNFALIAYTTGHYAAQAEAAKGASTGDVSYLQRAYQMNAFADHYLTDLFAAGHLRTPRLELKYETSNTGAILPTIAILSAPVLLPLIAAVAPGLTLAAGAAAAIVATASIMLGNQEKGTVGGLLAKCMHDEDNHLGLNVCSQFTTTNDGKTVSLNGQSLPVQKYWRAYGDTELFSDANSMNRIYAQAAVQASANDVYNAWKGGAFASTALQYVADIKTLTADPTNRKNHSPLFVIKDKALKRRDKLADVNNYDWNKCWDSLVSLLSLYAIEAFGSDRILPANVNYPFPPAAGYVASIDSSIDWDGGGGYVWQAGGAVNYAVAYQYATGYQSNKSPWMAQPAAIPEGFSHPTIILPAPLTGVTGWIIYRKFRYAVNMVQPQVFIYPLKGAAKNASGQYIYKDTNN